MKTKIYKEKIGNTVYTVKEKQVNKKGFKDYIISRAKQQ